MAADPQTASPIDPNVERQTRVFLEALLAGGGPPLETLAPKDARAVLTGAQASVDLKLPPAEVSERTIEQDGHRVRLHIVRPAGVSGVTPAFLFIHGGGWILGDFPTHERLVRDLVAGSGATAIFVNYTPSPEARFPVAIEENHAAAKWVAAHAGELGIDAQRLGVAGNSVGGNMSTVLCLMAKDRGGPALRCQILLWPVTNADFSSASYQQFAEAHFLTQAMMRWFWDAYTSDPAERAHRYASPLRASDAELAGLPPALIQTAECDVLRDEGEAYARRLDAAGVEVTLTRHGGLIHDYGLLNPVAHIPAVQTAVRQAAAQLKHYLG